MNIKKGGFILIIAIFTSSILLTVGLGILEITLFDLIVSNISREAAKATFAADAGLECIYRHDIVDRVFPYPETVEGNSQPVSLPVGNISCASAESAPALSMICNTPPPILPPGINKINRCTVTFSHDSATDEPCYTVTLQREVRFPASGPTVEETKITSIGKNDCDGPSNRRIIQGQTLTYGPFAIPSP